MTAHHIGSLVEEFCSVNLNTLGDFSYCSDFINETVQESHLLFTQEIF